MESIEELFNSLVVELKRGTTVLIVLSQLHSHEYGYSLVQKLDNKGVPIEAGTLYPLLRRLEKQKLLISEWDTSESRPRKYYTMSAEGKKVYKRLKKEWKQISNLLENVLEEDENESN
ncbi:MAG: PadR family transcriptional regulator [Epulopiscium sp.]|nr:PadR family transcriptional regulator [Candidatus Epulonipiscium sp.]